MEVCGRDDGAVSGTYQLVYMSTVDIDRCVGEDGPRRENRINKGAGACRYC